MYRICIDSFVDDVSSVRGKNGKLYRFEFSEMFGPSLIDAKGEILKRQPISPNHPFWEPFNEWLLQRSKLRHGAVKGSA